MARYAGGGRYTCEECISLDVRRLRRADRLRPGQRFSWVWSRGGEPAGNIVIETEPDAILLLYRARTFGADEPRGIRQRVPITWTPCAFGGRRPWFVCAVHANGQYCGRRVAILYGAGDLLACRICYRLAYASQSEDAYHRNIRQAQKIRTRLGGDPSLFEDFPERPPRMHWRTYERLRARGLAAEGQSEALLVGFLNRLRRASC